MVHQCAIIKVRDVFKGNEMNTFTNDGFKLYEEETVSYAKVYRFPFNVKVSNKLAEKPEQVCSEYTEEDWRYSYE